MGGVLIVLVLIAVIVAVLWPYVTAILAIAVGIGVLWGAIAAVINYIKAIADNARRTNEGGENP